MLSDQPHLKKPELEPYRTTAVFTNRRAGLQGMVLALLGLIIIVWSIFIQQIPEYHFKPGEEADTPYLTGTGDPEKNDAFTYRLTQPEWTLVIPGLNPQSYELRLTLSSQQTEPVQVIDEYGHILATFTPGARLEEYRINIPAESIVLYRLYLKIKSSVDPSNNSAKTELLLNKVDLIPVNFFLLPSLPVVYNVLGVTLGALLFLAGFYIGCGKKTQLN